MPRGVDRVLKTLQEIVGRDYASNEEAILMPYSFDLTWNEPRMPDYVVMPKTVEEVQRVLSFANRERIPVVPYVSSTNIGGLCIPEEGGIVLDLRRMNRIIKIDTETHYAVIEPGVSHAQFSRELKKVGFEFGWGVHPASASVLAMTLQHGIGHLNGRFGVNSQFISSMEVVLPTGEVCKIGSCAYSDEWHSLLPLPMLAGLFIGWLGTTGVVTKLGVWITRIRPYKDVLTIAAEDAESMTKYMVMWRDLELCDEITAVSWWLAQIPIPYPYQEKPPDAPEWFSYTVISGWSEEELEYKRKMWKEVVAKARQKGCKLIDFEYPPEAKRGRTELPSRIVGSTKNYSKSCGGGLAWPGTFTPAKNWPILYEKMKEIYIKHGLSPATRFTDYRGAHYGMWRVMTPFDKRNPEAVWHARQAMREVVEVGVKAGMIPYKPPVDYWNVMNAHADPGWLMLLCKIKDCLDPNHIMNPGKLGIR
ncbi:MAG: FAD-binding oxidoreductase [Candidatus Verstraetearchaeota archaeon]|nr:FAD-binding oxidoreductase [Candidatus Verstraetearchaeota archaeon]